MKVYLVTSGCYSDDAVDGVFSSRELAEKMMYIGGFESYNDIEEKELDDQSLLKVGDNYEIGPTFSVRIYLESGQLEKISSMDSKAKYRHPMHCIENCREEPRDIEYRLGPNVHVDGYIIMISPISYEHAQKVAIEKRQEWLRTRKMEI